MISEEDFKNECDEYQLLLGKYLKDTSSFQSLSNSKLKPIQALMQLNAEKIECQEGCSYCCHYRVTAFTHEIIIIYEYIRDTLTKNEMQKLTQKISKNAKKIESISAEEHFKTNIACAFLNDNKCSIYSIRPAACASCYSPDKNYCQAIHEDPSQYEKMAQNGQAPKVIDEISTGTKIQKAIIHISLQKMLRDNSRYELNTSLSKLFKDPSLIEKWKKTGEKIFA